MKFLYYRNISNNTYLFLFSLTALVMLIALQMNLMDIDSAQYASIAKEMFYNKSYLQVFCRGTDYLDKPPLVFWAACASFKIFGVHDWAFRLPSFLVLLLGIYATYRLAKIYYSIEVAKLAALIMASCQASFLMAHDVRMETMLTGWVMLAIWQLAEFFKNAKTIHFLFASVAVGLAMLTKGPIGLVIPTAAFAAHFAYKRQWANFFKWQYILGLVIVAIILLPMSYGLYQQFDLHPEKTVYGLSGPSGLRFYYWTQSFGRITGENYWDNNPDTFFLVHSLIWSFLPWSVFLFVALFYEIKETIKGVKTFANTPELISLGGFIIVLIFMSLSKYQLPHYTFAIHPLAAIITANYLNKNLLENSSQNLFIKYTNIVLLFIFFLLVLLVSIFVFPLNILWIGLSLIPFIGLLFISFNNKINLFSKVVFSLVVATCVVNIFANTWFYPQVFKYQSDSQIAMYVNKNYPTRNVLAYKIPFWYSMDFYLNKNISSSDKIEEVLWNVQTNQNLIITDSIGYQSIKSVYPQIKIVKEFKDFPASSLNGQFLNLNTREKALNQVYLLK